MNALVFIGLLLLNLNLNAQQITGIGVIKLGETQAQLFNDLKITEKDVVDGLTKTSDLLYKAERKKKLVKFKYDPTSIFIKELSSQTNNLDNQLEVWGIQKCSDAVSYRMPDYEIAGINISSLKLIFYKDTLTKIYYSARDGENQIFLSAFKAKYGEPTLTKQYSGVDSDNSTTKIYSWSTNNPDIAVTGKDYTYYTKEGTERINYKNSFYTFVIENKNLNKLLEECNKNGSGPSNGL